MLRALTGISRFKIYIMLAENKDGMTVTEIARATGSSLSKISHQLRILKQNGLVKSRGTNRETIYMTDAPKIKKCLSIIIHSK